MSLGPTKPHDFQPPPPAQASVRDLICTKCGARRSVAAETECSGRHPANIAETIHDYDPME